jgi:hypothetical protein
VLSARLEGRSSSTPAAGRALEGRAAPGDRTPRGSHPPPTAPAPRGGDRAPVVDCRCHRAGPALRRGRGWPGPRARRDRAQPRHRPTGRTLAQIHRGPFGAHRSSHRQDDACPACSMPCATMRTRILCIICYKYIFSINIIVYTRPAGPSPASPHLAGSTPATAPICDRNREGDPAVLQMGYTYIHTRVPRHSAPIFEKSTTWVGWALGVWRVVQFRRIVGLNKGLGNVPFIHWFFWANRAGGGRWTGEGFWWGWRRAPWGFRGSSRRRVW